MFLVNGEISSTVSCQDRGLQFGDGLFETFAVRDGELMYWSLHWQRLTLGCQRLFIPLPNEVEIKQEIKSLLKNQRQQVIKLILTRGASQRGYHFDNLTMSATRIISRSDWPDFNGANFDIGIELHVCQTRLARQPLLAGLKHLNRLENVLARHEWRNIKIAEGLLSDTNGFVIEGTMSNIFLVKDQMLRTPDLSFCGVAGITRQRILGLAKKENIPVEICQLDKNDLREADEIFMCNSLIGIWPVRKIDRQVYPTKKSSNTMTRLLQAQIS